MRIHEPAVALTDLAIGVEAGALRAAHGPRAARRRRTVAAGGRRRGAGSSSSSARRVRRPWPVPRCTACSRTASIPRASGLWRVSLGSIGVAGLSAWCLGAVLALPRAAATRVERTMIAVHAAYLLALSRTNPPYKVAIATYLPGALALGAALVRRLADPVVRAPAAIALAGLGLTFGAAAVQVRRLALHPRLFDHNATYHAIQAVAIACFYAAARGFTQPTGRR